jgi:SAM-dependent methyltransferase
MYDFLKEYAKDGDRILDVGSQRQEGDPCYQDLLEILQLKCDYIGADIEEGDNVDVIVSPETWDIVNDYYHIVISGQTLEHCEFPWQTVQEMARVLKPGGYMCIIAPKIQKQHRFPVDCWRFLPDGMKALGKWAGLKCIKAKSQHCGFGEAIRRPVDCWAIFQKDKP